MIALVDYAVPTDRVRCRRSIKFLYIDPSPSLQIYIFQVIKSLRFFVNRSCLPL